MLNNVDAVDVVSNISVGKQNRFSHREIVINGVSNIFEGRQNRFSHREIVFGVSNISEGRQNRFSHQDATLPLGLRKDVPPPPHLAATSVFP